MNKSGSTAGRMQGGQSPGEMVKPKVPVAKPERLVQTEKARNASIRQPSVLKPLLKLDIVRDFR